MSSAPLLVLVHSPLVGSLTWSLVAKELRRRGIEAVVPSLLDAEPNCGSYWSAHATAVATALRGAPPDRRVVLVAHSGAGPLLPALSQRPANAVACYLFVDAPLPGRDGQSRLDLFEVREAEQFRAAVVDGLIPAVWRSDDSLRALGIEDARLRQRFAAEVPDVPLAVYEEPLPVLPDWPDAPCGYLLFSAPYEADARRAQVRGWAFRELPGGHFHMLVEPLAVADALLNLVHELGA